MLSLKVMQIYQIKVLMLDKPPMCSDNWLNLTKGRFPGVDSYSFCPFTLKFYGRSLWYRLNQCTYFLYWLFNDEIAPYLTLHIIQCWIHSIFVTKQSVQKISALIKLYGQNEYELTLSPNFICTNWGHKKGVLESLTECTFRPLSQSHSEAIAKDGNLVMINLANGKRKYSKPTILKLHYCDHHLLHQRWILALAEKGANWAWNSFYLGSNVGNCFRTRQGNRP